MKEFFVFDIKPFLEHFRITFKKFQFTEFLHLCMLSVFFSRFFYILIIVILKYLIVSVSLPSWDLIMLIALSLDSGYLALFLCLMIFC